MTLSKHKSLHIVARRTGMAVIIGAGALVGARPALAVDNGPTIAPSPCMQESFGTPVTGSNRLNCTANDISLSEAISVSPSTCIEGETFTLTATFATDVTANARYDAAFYFNISGVAGTNARGDGSTNQCSVSALTPGVTPALNLDGDTCGDLNAGDYELTFTIPGVVCAPVSATDRRLRLPNCTAWHSNASTACNITDPLTLDPETKSKCTCDDNFAVGVIVESPTGELVKRAQKAEVTYDIEVTNTSQTRSVNLTRLCDDQHGTIFGSGCLAGPLQPISTTTCSAQVLDPGESYPCSFVVEYDQPGGSADPVTDTVTARLVDTLIPSNITDVSGSATVTIDLP